MRVNVVGKNMDVTDAIRTYAEQKVAKLPKHYDGVQQITVRLEQNAHNKGFHAEIVADVEKHDDFVGNATEPDLYHAVDLAVDKVSRQLTSFKERLKHG